MSLARRRMLLEYARQHQCWIIEDDYDSEFRYGSRPLASLQGLDTSGQVIYVGSFGKTLFPGLADRLHGRAGGAGGELSRRRQRRAVSRRAVAAAGDARRVHRGRAFHVAYPRMRTLYGQRRQTLARRRSPRVMATRLPIVGGDAGLHLVLRLPDGSDDRAVAAAALAAQYRRAAVVGVLRAAGDWRCRAC